MENKRIQELEAQLLGEYAGRLLVDEEADKLDMQSPALERPALAAALEKIRREHEKRQHRRKVHTQAVQAVAAVCIVLLGSFAVLYTQVEAFRIQFLNLFVRQEIQYISYATETDLKAAGFANAPAYIPEEYTDSHIVATPDLKQLILSSTASDSILYFEQHSADTSGVYLDAETTIEIVPIGGMYQGTLLTGKGTVLFWEQGGYFYKIDGAGLDGAEAIKIAESLKTL